MYSPFLYISTHLHPSLFLSPFSEEQQRQAQRSASQLQPTTSAHTPSPQPNPTPVHSKHPASHSPNLPLHQPPTSAAGQQVSQSTSSLPYPVDDSLSSMPYPVSSPVRDLEHVRYLREMNVPLQWLLFLLVQVLLIIHVHVL